jgi:hypothetical protein
VLPTTRRRITILAAAAPFFIIIPIFAGFTTEILAAFTQKPP